MSTGRLGRRAAIVQLLRSVVAWSRSIRGKPVCVDSPIDDDTGLRRFTGIRDGVGELEGSLIEKTGWGRRVGDSFTGTIQMSVIEA